MTDEIGYADAMRELDEKLEDLGDRLCLSPRVEPLRAKLEAELTPIINPRPRSNKNSSPAFITSNFMLGTPTRVPVCSGKYGK